MVVRSFAEVVGEFGTDAIVTALTAGAACYFFDGRTVYVRLEVFGTTLAVPNAVFTGAITGTAELGARSVELAVGEKLGIEADSLASTVLPAVIAGALNVGLQKALTVAGARSMIEYNNSRRGGWIGNFAVGAGSSYVGQSVSQYVWGENK